MAFDPTDNENTTSLLAHVENCISDIRIWMVENKLKLNDDKTEVLILTSKLHRSIHYIAQVVVVGAAIPPILTVRNLGAMFDQSLTISPIISQNMAARLLTKTGKRDHVIPILRALHWLPFRHRIIFKVLLLTFKALNNLAPDYLTLLLDTIKPQSY